MKRRVEKSIDFISDLPRPILHHILSYLSSEDSVRTCVLSKQWNSVQKSFPILEFKHPTHMWAHFPRFKERLGEYLYCVDRSLQNFIQEKCCIEKLNLHLSIVDLSSVPLVNTWLPLALHNGEFDLRFDVSTEDGDFYPLPETTFAVNSNLHRGSSNLFLLQTLQLFKVYLSEEIVRDIIHNCPNLIDLNLSDFLGLKTLNISKLDKLTTLTVDASKDSTELTAVFVDALSLLRFYLEMDYEEGVDGYIRWEIDLTSCCNMRELELHKSPITDAQFNLNISKFPLLEVLKIVECFDLRRIRISLQRLKLLYLNCCAFKSIEIDAPALSELCYVVTDEELPVFVLANAIRASICLRLDSYHTYLFIDSFWFLRIREYLNVPFKSINLDVVSYCQVRFDPYELRELVIPPTVDLDSLDLNSLVLEDPSQWETLLDGLLWSCHPKTVLISAYSSSENYCVETLCRMLNQSECRLCVNLSHCECWRRRYKAATIESTGDIEFDVTNIRNVSKERVQSRILKGNLSSNPKSCSLTFRFDWRNPV